VRPPVIKTTGWLLISSNPRDLLRPYRGSMAKWNFWQRLRDRRLVPCMLPLGQM
jgi:hypothetical protein